MTENLFIFSLARNLSANFQDGDGRQQQQRFIHFIEFMNFIVITLAQIILQCGVQILQ